MLTNIVNMENTAVQTTLIEHINITTTCRQME